MNRNRNMMTQPISPILRQADQSIMQNGNRLGSMLGKTPIRRADGGKVGASVDAMKLVKDAIDHLNGGDTASARQVLRSVDDPDVQAASADMSRGPGGIRLAIKKLEALVESLSNSTQVPMLKKGGKVK